MPSFRLITEGVTDQVTLEIILSIFYNDPDIDVERLQPPGDETDRYKQKDFGGWGMVFQYLKSIPFREAMDFADYFIIKIDTDVSQEFGVPHHQAGRDLTPREIIDLVIMKLTSTMGEEFYQAHREKFLFAICVHSIECWFLPLYYSDNRRSKLLNCLETLNRILSKTERFVIAPENKQPRLYETLSRKFRNKKSLRQMAAHSPSFNIFIETLPQT